MFSIGNRSETGATPLGRTDGVRQVRVLCRIRPPNADELAQSGSIAVRVRPCDRSLRSTHRNYIDALLLRHIIRSNRGFLAPRSA